MPLSWLGTPFDPLRRLFSSAGPIQPEPDPYEGLNKLFANKRHPFYNLPQAQSMEAMGGIYPEDVPPQPDPTGGALTRGLTRGTLAIGEGLSELGSHLPGLVIPGAPPTKGLQDAATRSSQMQDALRTQYEKTTPIEQQLLAGPTHPFSPAAWGKTESTVMGAIGESAPQMALAAAGPLGIAAGGLGIGGQQSRQFREQGIEGARNLIPSVASGLVISYMDRLGLEPTIRGVAAPKLMRVFTQALSEGSMEALQEIPSMLSEMTAGTHKGESGLQIAKELYSRAWRSGMMGGVVGGALGQFTPTKVEVEERNANLRRLQDASEAPNPGPVVNAVLAAARPMTAPEVNASLTKQFAQHLADTPSATLSEFDTTFGEEPDPFGLPPSRMERLDWNRPLPSARTSLETPDHEVLGLAHQITRSLGSTPLSNAAAGVTTGSNSEVDQMLMRHPEQGAAIYSAFQPVRDLLRKKYGDALILYRAQGPERARPDSPKLTLNYASRSGAERYMREGRSLDSAVINVNDILAVHNPTGRYEEYVVRIGDAPKSKPNTAEAGFARFPADALKQWFHTYVLTPAQRRASAPGLHRALNDLYGRATASAEEIQRNADELTRMTRSLDKSALPEPLQAPEMLAQYLDKAYRGLVPITSSAGKLPTLIESYMPSVIEPIKSMREHADRIATDMRRYGLMTDGVARNLERKFGLHVHRDFQSRFDTDYQALVQEQPLFRRAFELWRDQELSDAYKQAEDAYRKFHDDPAAVPPSGKIREEVLKSWREEIRQDRPDGDPEIVGVVTVPKVRKVGQGAVDATTGNPIYEWADTPTEVRVKSQKQIEGKLIEYVTWANRGGGVPLPGGHIEAGKNLGTVMQRTENMPDLERLLLGETKDPVANYVNSLHQMASMVEHEKFLRQLKDIGLNRFLFHQPRPGFTEMIDPSHIAIPTLKGGSQMESGLMEQVDPSAEERGKTGQEAGLAMVQGRGRGVNPTQRRVSMQEPAPGGPLGPLYTSTDIRQELMGNPDSPITVLQKAIDEQSMIGGAMLRTWYTLAHLTKAGQTVGSVQATNRNYLSNSLYLIANAHNPAILLGGVLQGMSHLPGLGMLRKVIPGAMQGQVSVAYQPVVEQFYNLTANPKTQGKPLDRALVQKRQRYLELGIIRQSTDVGDLKRLASRAYNAVKAGEGGENRFNNALNLLLETYMSHDDLPKIAAFEHELAVLKKASDLEGPPDYRELEHQAADKVRRTMQNYEDLPRGVQVLSANPLVAPFLSFNASLVRNAYNIIKLGAEEFRSDNPVIKKRGAARLGGFVASLSIPAATAAVMRHMSNSDNDDEEALRKIGYPWSRNSTLSIVKRKGNEITYFDMGFIDVFNKLKAPAMAIIRRIESGEPIDEGFVDAVSETMGLGGASLELFTQAAIEGATGQKYETDFPFMTPRGRIWEEADSMGGRMKRAAQWMAYQVAPGTYKTGTRIARSLDKTSPEVLAGRGYKTGSEVLSIFGPRLVTFKLDERLASDAVAFNRLKRSASSATKRDVRQGASGDAERHQQVLDDMIEKVKAYKQLGLTSFEIKRILAKNGVGGDLASALAYENTSRALRMMTKNLEIN